MQGIIIENKSNLYKIKTENKYFDDSKIKKLLGNFSYLTLGEYSDEIISYLYK